MHLILRKTNFSYQGVRNTSFSENLAHEVNDPVKIFDLNQGFQKRRMYIIKCVNFLAL